MRGMPTLDELKEILFDDEKCVEYLLEEQIIRTLTNCSTCLQALRLEETHWRCTSRSCRKKISIFKNTMLSNSRLSPSKFILVGYLWLSKIKPTSIITTTGCSSRTITNALLRFRKKIDEKMDFPNKKIGGEGKIVEIDESKFGKKEK
jgi:hypothetical protein